MKIKSLQINVLALLFGFTTICFVNKTEASSATKLLEGQPFFEQNDDDDFSDRNQDLVKTTPKRGNAVTSLNWTFRGPDDMAGKVTSVVHSSSNPQIVYVGAAHNGVWKSTDGGGREWNKIPVENNLNLYVTCIALNEESNVLYAGTGGDFTGQGIYKSEAGGTFKLMSGSENWANVYKIGTFGGKVYAATNAGLWCHTDGTWKICTGTKSGESVVLDGPVRDISINKAGLIIAAMNKIECYISKTGSSNGFEYNALTGDIDIYTADNISVVASPADENVLYVVVVRPNTGELEKALLSDNQGGKWEVILSWIQGYFLDPLEKNGLNINNIYADPVDPYMLYIASRNIWKGKRYASGPFDFGLSAISTSDGPKDNFFYLHSNVRAIDFYASYGDYSRAAYVATDGGIYHANMYISIYEHFTVATDKNKNLIVGSYDYVSANNKGDLLMGTPTLGVQAIDAGTNYSISARSVWDISDAAKEYLTEGVGGPCAISAINEQYYAYSLFIDGALTFRRSIDIGTSFHPKREGAVTVEWFTNGMLPDARYITPMVMWESFTDDKTYDTVWFKADTITNFTIGDRTIYATSKNASYPIEYSIPTGIELAHGDSIPVLDPIQNRMFVGMVHQIWMTREALDYTKTPLAWYQIGTLDVKDTSSVFAISDDANTLYIGTHLGNIHRLTNLKEVYSDSTLKSVQKTLAYAFTDKKIRAIAVDPTDADHVVVVLEGSGDNIYETTNGSSEPATFNLIKKDDLPNNIYSVLFPKGAKKGTIMVGTEKGIWMKESGSNIWEANNNGLGEGKVPVMTLTQLTTHRPGVRNVLSYDWGEGKKIRVDYPNNTSSYLAIYAGTYGSGIFSTDEYVGIDEITPNTPREYTSLNVVPNPVRDIATIKLDMTKGQAMIHIYSVDGRCMRQQTAKSNINTIDFTDYDPGTYIIYVIQGDIVKSAKVIKL